MKFVCVNTNRVMEKFRSLKAVPLHNGNRRPSIPLVHAVDMKEIHENMSLIQIAIHYNTYEWQICGDLEVIGLSFRVELSSMAVLVVFGTIEQHRAVTQ